ncbi:MAG: protein NirI, partial [Rhodobacteraceae bacterium]|nr:protein NirI [Paracoccaceae bacterium]
MRPFRFLAFVALSLCFTGLSAVSPQAATEDKAATAPSRAQVSALLNIADPFSITRVEDGVPGWTIRDSEGVLGFIGSTWEIAESVGYSGRPLDVLVAVSPEAKIAGAILVQHNEPVLTLGISDEDISSYVSSFSQHDLRQSFEDSQKDLPDVISRATVSTGVIRDGILRTARTLAAGRGLIANSAGIDRLSYDEMDWPGLIEAGALASARVTMTEASGALAGAKVPVQPGEGDFLHLWAGLVDPPSVGQSLLGQQVFTGAVGSLGPGETALVVISSGLYSHRGTAWRRSGVFDRLTIAQGEVRLNPEVETYTMVKRLRIEGAPQVKEISLFRLPKTIDPLEPMQISVRATRPALEGGEVSLVLETEYALPVTFRNEPPAEPEPLWVSSWRDSHLEIAI